MADTQVLEACASAWGFESPLPHQRLTRITENPTGSNERDLHTARQHPHHSHQVRSLPRQLRQQCPGPALRLGLLLVFGKLEHQSQEEVTVENFQGIYLSPQQAKALQSILNHNVAQYEQTFGPISLAAAEPAEPRFVMPQPKGPVH